MKKGYLAYVAYVVYNLMDGHDLDPVRVFNKLGDPVDAIHQEMEDNEDSALISEMTGTGTVYKEYDRSYNIKEVDVYD